MDRQYDDRYRLPADFSENPGNLKRQRFVEDVQASANAALPSRPPEMPWFEELMRKRDFSAKTRPRVGFLCNMIPQELPWALGAEAVRLDCGNAGAALLGEEMLSGEICPLAKASFGVFLNKESLASSCDAVALPSSCDAKRKLGQVLNDFKPCFMMNLPPEQSHTRYGAFAYEEMLRLAGFLEERLGRKLKAGALLEAIKLGRRRTALVRELQALRAANPRAMSYRDFLLITQSSQFRPIEIGDWLAHAEKALAWAKALPADSKPQLKPRLLLTGAPVIWPNFKVLNVLEECGAEIVADTICSGAQSLYDPAVVDETGLKPLLRALSNRCAFASLCPCFISQDSRLNRVLSLAAEAKADGIVNHSLRLCQLFDMETFRLEKTLKGAKKPFLNLRTDYSLEDTEQLRVRIEAFLETLQ